MLRNTEKLNGWGLTSAALLQDAGYEDIEPSDRAKGIRRVKSKFQAVTRKMLARIGQPDKVFRIRTRLQRWNLDGLERQVADRTARMLKRLAKLVPPRVAHSCGLESCLERLDDCAQVSAN